MFTSQVPALHLTDTPVIMVFKDTIWDLMRGKHFEVFLYFRLVVANLPASEMFQPIRRQAWGSAPITIRAGEGRGQVALFYFENVVFAENL